MWGLQLHLAPASVVVTNGGICAPPPPALPGRPGSSPSRSDFLTLHFYFLCFMNKIKRVNSLSGIGCTSGTPPHPPPRTTLPPRRRLLQLVSLWHTPLCMYRCVCVCVCVWGWLCVTPPPPPLVHLTQSICRCWSCFKTNGFVLMKSGAGRCPYPPPCPNRQQQWGGEVGAYNRGQQTHPGAWVGMGVQKPPAACVGNNPGRCWQGQ